MADNDINEESVSARLEHAGKVVSETLRRAGVRVGPGEMTVAPGAVHILDEGKIAYTFDLTEASEQARRVVDEVFQALNLFLEKNKGYGSTGYNLGAKGQYADMNRKMGKLKHTLWEGNPVVGESITEMLQDLIGHAGLTIDYIKMEESNQ